MSRREVTDGGTSMVVHEPFGGIVRRPSDVTGTEGFFVLADSVGAAPELPDPATGR